MRAGAQQNTKRKMQQIKTELHTKYTVKYFDYSFEDNVQKTLNCNQKLYVVLNATCCFFKIPLPKIVLIKEIKRVSKIDIHFKAKFPNYSTNVFNILHHLQSY